MAYRAQNSRIEKASVGLEVMEILFKHTGPTPDVEDRRRLLEPEKNLKLAPIFLFWGSFFRNSLIQLTAKCVLNGLRSHAGLLLVIAPQPVRQGLGFCFF
jgi:hypothetical protein